MKKEKKEKIICKECGIDMNFHAEKINYSKMYGYDHPVLSEDELIDEIHTCPECGKSESCSST